MDKLKKVGLTALGTALVSTAAYAGELSVTGGAGITFVGKDNGDTGNGWSASDTLTFSGSADLDNGMTVTLTHKIDGGANDVNTIAIDTGGMGTLSFHGQDGTGPIGSWDDMTPSANEESWALVSGTVSAAHGGLASMDDTFTYTNSDIMDGVTLTVFHSPSDGATALKLENEIASESIQSQSVDDVNKQYHEELLKNQEAENIVENISEDNDASFSQEALSSSNTEESSNDLKEFGVDTDEPDLFNIENQASKSEDLLGSSDEDQEEDDLEIPAFLRRQKN